MSIKLFVYGTLRYGEGNWRHYLSGFPAEEDTLSGAILKNLGGFPGLRFVEDKTKKVIGELFNITKTTLCKIDGLEGFKGEDVEGNLFDRVTVTLDSGIEAFTYVWCYQDNSPIIESGNWIQEIRGRVRNARY